MKGLIIDEPWISQILSGRKTWEMRKTSTSIRETVALIRKGSGQIVGTARIVGSLPPLSDAEYAENFDKHRIPPQRQAKARSDGWATPWVLADARPLARPVRYSHPSGAVIWVNLQPDVVAEVNTQSMRITGASSGATVTAVSRQDVPVRTAPATSLAPARTVARTLPPAFTPSGTDSQEAWYVFGPERAQAFGQPLSDGRFLVRAGSTAMRNGSPSVKRDGADREALVRSGVLIPDTDPALFRFSTDHKFRNSSNAAGVIKDGNASGPTLWKHVKTGKTLKDST